MVILVSIGIALDTGGGGGGDVHVVDDIFIAAQFGWNAWFVHGEE
jgi:hypothetical protein